MPIKERGPGPVPGPSIFAALARVRYPCQLLAPWPGALAPFIGIWLIKASILDYLKSGLDQVLVSFPATIMEAAAGRLLHYSGGPIMVDGKLTNT